MKHLDLDTQLLFGAYRSFYGNYIFFEDCFCERGKVKANDLHSTYATKQCDQCHNRYRTMLVEEKILSVHASLFPGTKGVQTKILVDDWKQFQENRKEKIATCRIGDYEQKFLKPEEGIERRKTERTPLRNIFRKRQKGEEGKIIVVDYVDDPKCAAMVQATFTVNENRFKDKIPQEFIDGIILYELKSCATREAAQTIIAHLYGENLKNYWME